MKTEDASKQKVTQEEFDAAFKVIERARNPRQGSCELEDESLRRLVQLLCGRSPVAVITQTTISDDITRIHVHRVLSENNGYELRNTL